MTRTLVDADDPGFASAQQADRALPARTTRPRCSSSTARPGRTAASRGWRRVVASPEPREILDAAAVHALVEAGFVVVANGGGGIPVVREDDRAARRRGGHRQGPRGRAARPLRSDADVLVVATDVPHAVLRFGTPEAEPRRPGRRTTAAGAGRRGALRQRLHGPEGRGGLPLRRAGRHARRHHHAGPHPRRRRRRDRHRRRTHRTKDRAGPDARAHRSTQGPDPDRLRRQRSRRPDRRRRAGGRPGASP